MTSPAYNSRRPRGEGAVEAGAVVRGKPEHVSKGCGTTAELLILKRIVLGRNAPGVT